MTTVKFCYDSIDQIVGVYGMPGALASNVLGAAAATVALAGLGYTQTTEWKPSGGEGMYVAEAQG